MNDCQRGELDSMYQEFMIIFELVFGSLNRENKQHVQAVRTAFICTICETRNIDWPVEWIPLILYTFENGFEIAGKYLIDDLKMESLLDLLVHFMQKSFLLLTENESESVEHSREIVLEKYKSLLKQISRFLSLIQLNLHKKHRENG